MLENGRIGTYGHAIENVIFDDIKKSLAGALDGQPQQRKECDAHSAEEE
jgi:hypothetical protein